MGSRWRKMGISIGLSILGLLATLAAWFWLPASVRYKITETYSFTVPAGEQPSVALAVLLPQSGPGQNVSPPDIAWEGERTQQEAGGLVIIKLEGPAQEARINYIVTLRQGTVRWDAPVQEAQLLAQENIEVHDAQIRELASRLGSDLTDERQIAYRHFEYVAHVLEWPTGARVNVEPSAVAALQSGVGGCNEFSNLMVALDRAAGIPAETVSGLSFASVVLPFVSQSQTWGHPAGAHAWVAFHSGNGWEMADPSWAGSLPLPGLLFGRNDGNHLAYAEQDLEAQAYEAVMSWAETQGTVVAAMSAPLKFAAAAQHEGVTVKPGASVTKTWDGRLINVGLVVAALAIVSRWVERKSLKKPV